LVAVPLVLGLLYLIYSALYKPNRTKEKERKKP
jgi:hypothetical protein